MCQWTSMGSPGRSIGPQPALAHLGGDEVGDGRRHALAGGRRGPRRGLAGEHLDAGLGHPPGGEQAADGRRRVGAARVDQPVASRPDAHC